MLNTLSFDEAQAQSSFITKVYGWMSFALALTAGVAMFTASSDALMHYLFSTPYLLIGLFLAQLALVSFISGLVGNISGALATTLFIVYSVANGLTLSVIFMVYTGASIAGTFFATAATFGAMSIYGYTTKRDLSTLGNLLFMALIGFVIATVVNMFFFSEMLYWIITYVGIIIFVGLVAYDTQKLKEMSLVGFQSADAERKGAILGALALYLDFLNLFLLLLRILGRRR
jgi:FtsH-binding integral membrane protein